MLTLSPSSSHLPFPFHCVAITGATTPGAHRHFHIEMSLGLSNRKATSCAQGRRPTQSKPPVFNVTAETKQLSRDRGMWLAVRKCAHLSVGWAQKLAQSR